MAVLKQVRSEEELTEVMHRDASGYWAIFKHSNRCSVSLTVKKIFESEAKPFAGLSDIAWVDVVSDRSLSQFIASKYDVKHESPQLIIGKADAVLFHSSHENIDASSLFSVIV